MLKEQNDHIKQVLNNMFGSLEDSVIVQKEILKIMQESKPTDGMFADKGLDVVIQLVFNVVQIYLKLRGIMILLFGGDKFTYLPPTPKVYQ